MEESKLGDWNEWAQYLVRGMENLEKANEKLNDNIDSLGKRLNELEVEQGKLSTAFHIKSGLSGGIVGGLIVLGRIIIEMVKNAK